MKMVVAERVKQHDALVFLKQKKPAICNAGFFHKIL